MAITRITVRGTYNRPHRPGAASVTPDASSGTVHLTPQVQMIDGAGQVVMPASKISADLVAGAFAITVVASDSADVTPTNVLYRYGYEIDGQTGSFLIFVPSASPGGILDISAVTPASPTQPTPVPGVFVPQIQDESVVLPTEPVLDFQGSGVTVTHAPGKNVVTVPGTVGGVSSVNTRTGAVTGLAEQSSLDAEAATARAAEGAKLDRAANLSDIANGSSARANLGLGNVSNTSDANKPVSTAQQTALDLKLALTGGTLTGPLTLAADPVGALEPATKQYADAIASGLQVKAAARVATTANITLSGTQTIDGVAVAAGDRVLVKAQTTGSANGLYVVAAGAWARATDANTSAKVKSGLFAFIAEGTTLADTGWALVTDDPITLGTTALVFGQFSGPGTTVAGTGLARSGNTLSADFGTGAGKVVEGNNAALTDTRTPSALSVTTGTIADKAVTPAKQADAAANSLRGNNTGSAATPLDLTAAQVRTLLGSLDGFTAPTADLSINNHKLLLVTDGANASDAATVGELVAVGPLFRTGAIASTFPRNAGGATNTNLLSTGRLQMVAVVLPANKVITSITFVSGATAMVTGTDQWFSLHDSTRALLRQTVDDGATAWAASTEKTLALTSTFTTTYYGVYYLGVMVAATTIPSLIGYQVSAVLCALPPIITGTSTTGLTTTAPNPAAAITASTAMPYAHVS